MFCTEPAGRTVVAICRGAGWVGAGLGGADFSAVTIRENLVETETALASCTLVMNEKAPAEAGAPAIVPVSEFKAKPAGSRPLTMLQEYGGVPPLTASVAR